METEANYVEINTVVWVIEWMCSATNLYAGVSLLYM